MATTPEFIDYIAGQAALGAAFTHKRMFGEYGLYLHGKLIALACDNSLFVKVAPATDALTAAVPRRPPYPGAKPCAVADELLDDGEALRALLVATEAALPAPKPKKKPRGRQT